MEPATLPLQISAMATPNCPFLDCRFVAIELLGIEIKHQVQRSAPEITALMNLSPQCSRKLCLGRSRVGHEHLTGEIWIDGVRRRAQRTIGSLHKLHDQASCAPVCFFF